MDYIKDAFQKVKQDISSLNEQILLLKEVLQDMTKELSLLKNTNNYSQQIEERINFSNNLVPTNPTQIPTNPTQIPTNPTQIPTNPTQIPTNNSSFKPLNTKNLPFSTGNEGVPTDRQTDQQTDRPPEKSSLRDAFDVLDSLDSIKKEIRNKFKRITDQEFLVFSTIYQLSEKNNFVDYKSLSLKLNLTESSIRDYVGKLIKKGIPVEKTKINNKLIQLSISQNLKKIAPLPIIFKLREL